MKKVKVIIEGKDEFEIKVEDKDLVSLINIIKVFDNSKSDKINP